MNMFGVSFVVMASIPPYVEYILHTLHMHTTSYSPHTHTTYTPHHTTCTHSVYMHTTHYLCTHHMHTVYITHTTCTTHTVSQMQTTYSPHQHILTTYIHTHTLSPQTHYIFTSYPPHHVPTMYRSFILEFLLRGHFVHRLQ